MNARLATFLMLLIISSLPDNGNAVELTSMSISDYANCMKRADLLFVEGKYNKSIELYNEAIILNQSSETAWIHKGDALMNLDNYQEAIESYDRAITILEYRKDSSSQSLDYILCNLYAVSMEYDLRERLYQSNNQVCENLRNPSKIIEELFPIAFSIYIEIPYNRMLPKPFGNVVDKIMRARGVINSIAIGGNILERTWGCLPWEASGSGDCKDRMTRLAQDSQDLQAEYHNAQEDFKEIVEQLKNVWNLKGESLLKLNRSDGYNLTKRKIAELTLSYARTWRNNRGFLYSMQDNYIDAIKCFDEALKIDLRDADAWFGKGVVLYKQGKIDEAIKAYDEVIKIDPKYIMAWNNKGLALGDLGNFNDALVCLNEAIRIDPQSAVAWYNKGVILKAYQQDKDAETAFAKAEELANRANK